MSNRFETLYGSHPKLNPENITLELVMDAYQKLPPVPPKMTLLLPVQAKINSVLSMQLESANVSVLRSQYLPGAPSPPRRRDYKTRHGYKHARNYWRSFERRFVHMGYLISQTMRKAEDDFVTRLFNA